MTIVMDPYAMMATFTPRKLRRLLFGNAHMTLTRLTSPPPQCILRKWYYPTRGVLDLCRAACPFEARLPADTLNECTAILYYTPQRRRVLQKPFAAFVHPSITTTLAALQLSTESKETSCPLIVSRNGALPPF